MPHPQVTLYADQLEWARQETLKSAQNVPLEKRLFQLREEKATPLWLMGHLANSVNTIIIRWMLGQESLVSRSLGQVFAPDFAGGTPPSSASELYPPWDEVVGLYDAVMKQAIEGVRALQDEDLPQPLKGNVPDALRIFFATNGSTLTRLISHDAYHRGQLNLLAKI